MDRPASTQEDAGTADGALQKSGFLLHVHCGMLLSGGVTAFLVALVFDVLIRAWRWVMPHDPPDEKRPAARAF